MGDPDAGAAVWSSIDPDELGTVITALTSTKDGIDDSVAPLKSSFTEYGVSTTNLTKLTGFATTIGELVPKLERRKGLAEHLLMVNPTHDGRVSYQGDLVGDFETAEEAAEQAEQDAEAIGEDGIDEDVLANLQKYANDPDYTEALIEAMGEEAFYELVYDQWPLGEEDPPPETLALADVWATNSYRHPVDQDMLKKIQDVTDIPAPMNLVAAYAQYGGFSEESLHYLADLRFNPDEDSDARELEIFDYDHETQVNILQALEQNPRAAATYLNANQELMFELINDGDKYNVADNESQAWADFYQAATVDARNEFYMDYLDNPGNNPAIQNAQWLIEKVGSEGRDKWPFTGEMRVTFANIAVEYMDDYAYTLGSPIDIGSVNDPGHDGVSNTTEHWQTFLANGMADNDGLLLIAAGMTEKIEELKHSSTLAEGSSPDDNALATFWDDYTAGAMQDTFVNLYAQVASDRDASEAEQEAFWNGLLDKGVDYAFDPKGIIKDVAKESIKALLHLGVGAAVESEPMPDMPTGFDTKLNYADEAVTRLDLDQPFPPYDDGTVTWDGDPEFYQEPSPPNGDFLQYIEDGKMNYEEIKKDPAAWSSYDKWLHDPAVQAAIADGFANQLLGSHDN